VPKPQQQADALKEILLEIEQEPSEPSPKLVCDTEEAIRHLGQHILDADNFVAGSF
jgi:hypothetical protein